MKLVEALKRKKLLVGEINDLANKIRQNNVWSETECATLPELTSTKKPPYNSAELYEAYRAKKAELIVMKAAIFRANAPVQHLIVELGELKDEITLLQSLDTRETRNPRVYQNSGTPGERYILIELQKAAITSTIVDERVAGLTSRILEVESALNCHNFTTEIDIA